MISTRWLEKRKQHWSRLETLLEVGHSHGIKSLTRSELRELSLLYRQTAADLSFLREDPASQPYARYLNQLLGRAHNTIYAGRKSSPASILTFYRRIYPRIFRQTLRFTAAAFGLFALSALIGMLLTATRPEFMRHMLGPQMVATIERREMWTHSIVGIEPLASGRIMTNNLTVSFVTFASGILAGLGTIFEMISNGLMLGVIGAACWLSGMSLQLWSFVAPHGVLELPAIFIAGGAGLMLADALLFPGVLSRRDSLAASGALAIRLVLGILPLLVIAGVVEGFISPSKLPVALKFLFAAVMFSLLLVYLFGWGEKKQEADAEG
jgi:uncharacterized membrane protein SpoIIM required for sporulation